MPVQIKVIPGRRYYSQAEGESFGPSHEQQIRRTPFAVRKRKDGTYKWYRGEAEVAQRIHKKRAQLDRVAHLPTPKGAVLALRVRRVDGSVGAIYRTKSQ